MSGPDEPDPELPDFEDEDSFLAWLFEEVPGYTRTKRYLRYLKEYIGREYIREIKALKKKNEALIETISAQTNTIVIIQRMNFDLEARIEGLQAELINKDKADGQK